MAEADSPGTILVSLVSQAPATPAQAASVASPPTTQVTDEREAASIEGISPRVEGDEDGDRRTAASEGSAVRAASAVSIASATGSDYRAQLLAHIQPFRRYPAQAQSLGAKGVAQILFMVDQEGKVIGVWVKASSGFETLDNEAVATVLRAQPMPHVPAGLPSPLAVQLPVSFNPS